MPVSTVKAPTPLESTLMSAILEHHDGPLNASHPYTLMLHPASHAIPLPLKVLIIRMTMLTDELQVDWEGVAQTMGYKNGQVASDRFRQVKKKLGWGAGSTTNKGSTPSRSKDAKARAIPASLRAPAARKPAAKKVGTNTKPRGAKAKAKFVQKEESEDDEKAEPEEEKPRDLMAGSDDEETDETSFEEKFNRGEYADDYESGNLSEGEVANLQCQIAEDDLQKQVAEQMYEEEYDAYDPDAVFEDAVEEYADANGRC